jgi:hypothetical protein
MSPIGATFATFNKIYDRQKFQFGDAIATAYSTDLEMMADGPAWSVLAIPAEFSSFSDSFTPTIHSIADCLPPLGG